MRSKKYKYNLVMWFSNLDIEPDKHIFEVKIVRQFSTLGLESSRVMPI